MSSTEAPVTPRVLVFEFSMPANLANARMHWREKHKRRERYLEVCDNRVLAKVNPPPPQTPIAKATAVMDIRTYRLADPDNAEARLKWCWDWLTTRGYLEDDSANHLTTTKTLRTVPRAQVGLTIRLTEVEG